jgi:hypothetical protein
MRQPAMKTSASLVSFWEMQASPILGFLSAMKYSVAEDVQTVP